MITIIHVCRDKYSFVLTIFAEVRPYYVCHDVNFLEYEIAGFGEHLAVGPSIVIYIYI